MRRHGVISGLGILALLLSMSGCQPTARDLTAQGSSVREVRTEQPARARSITVTGSAEVRVAPDEVVLTLGVETWDENINIAKSKNDDIVQRVLALARDSGIDPSHIQTDYVSIEPRYQDTYETRNFLGYFVRKTIALTLRDVSKFEELLSSVLGAGVNYVHGVEFRTTELRKYRDEARSLAIKAAREKAQALAKELGHDVGEPLTISEEQSNWWAGYSAWWGSRGGMMQQNVSQSMGETSWDSAGPTPPGQITVSARVTVEFDLR